MKLKTLIIFLFTTLNLLQAGSFFARLTPAGQQQLIAQQLFKATDIQYQTFRTFKQDILFLNQWVVLTADSQQLADFKAKRWLEEFQPVGSFKIFPLTNDSLVAQQWYLQKINIAQAWQVTQGSPQVLLAIIDTGIDYRHPDLQNSLWVNAAEKNGLPGVDDDQNGLVDDVIGWDFTDAPRFADGGDYLTPDPDPMDEFVGGHGTEIAGIIGATANNLRGIAGLAPKIKIMNLRAGTASGYLEEDDVIQAMLYAYAMGAKIINMSFGDVKISNLFRDVVHYLWQQGVTFVAAAGNEGQPQVYFPAALKETIAVGSCDADDRLSGFSNFGYGIDLIAPGSEIISTAPGNDYRRVSGTSFSAPMVAGVCALLLSADAQMDNENLRTILRNTAKQHLPNPDWQVGAGRLDAGKALHIEREGKLQLFARNFFAGITNSIVITASAYHPDLKSLTLAYGPGAHPDHWTVLGQWSYRYFYNDTLFILPVKNLPDTIWTFRLTMELLNRSSVSDIQQVVLDRTPPQFEKLIFDPAFQGEEVVGLLNIVTDDPVKVKLFFLKDEQSLPSDSLTVQDYFPEHFLTLNETRVADYRLLRVAVENQCGLTAQTTLQIPELFFKEKIWRPWQNLPLKQAPSDGLLLDKTVDLNLNGKPEIVISPYLDSGAIGTLNVFELSNNTFKLLTAFNQPVIPRDAADLDGDGRQELLVTYGNLARLLKFKPEQQQFETVWQDSNFWAGNLTDCDGDGRFEIMGYRDSSYLVLEDQGNFNFLQVARLQNYSRGENRLGAPKVLVSDFNGDGQNELVFGDYDGDVIIYTCSQAGDFHLWQILRAYQSDATDLLAAGPKTLFVLSHTSEGKKFESDLAQIYWTLEVFKYHERWRELRLDQRLHFFPYYSKKTFDAGLRFKTFNDRQFLFLSIYPALYVLEQMDGQWQVVWQNHRCRSNGVVAQDLDQNQTLDVLFNDGHELTAFTRNPTSALSVPFNLKARPLDSTQIKISWQGVLYNGFRLYRGNRPDRLEFLTEVTEKQYVDRSLSAAQSKYFYAVSAFDDSLESPLSEVDSVEICAAPRLVSVTKVAQNVFVLQFDQTIQFSGSAPARVLLKQNQLPARSLILMTTGYRLLSVFNFPPRLITPDTLIVSQLINRCQMPVHPQFNRLAVDLNAEIEAPAITECSVKNRTEVHLTFSQPMDSLSVLNTAHYQIWPWGAVQQVQILDKLITQVKLRLSVESPAGGFGQPAYLQVQGLKNKWQISMAGSQKFSLFRPVSDLSQVLIYPQPVRAEDRELIFAKLPQKAQIRIFNINGLLIKKLEQVNDFGGLHWDLKDQSGRPVASGVYLYHIMAGKQEKIGKLVIVR